jgi:hypothetical protein
MHRCRNIAISQVIHYRRIVYEVDRYHRQVVEAAHALLQGDRQSPRSNPPNSASFKRATAPICDVYSGDS